MDEPNPVATLERVRELEGEIAELRRGLDDNAGAALDGCSFHALEIVVGESVFLIPIDDIREVVPMAWPEPVAGAPDWVMGSISYGGVPTTLVDLGLRIHQVPTKLIRSLQTVVIEGERWLGLVVDAVGDVHRVNAAELTTPGTDIACAGFLIGLARLDGERSLPVLSITKVGRDIDD